MVDSKRENPTFLYKLSTTPLPRPYIIIMSLVK